MSQKMEYNRITAFFSDLLKIVLLVFLPFLSVYLIVSEFQKNQLQRQKEKEFNELAEITAHLSRLSTPQTYYQNQLRKIAENFKWATDTADISTNFNTENVELFLFDSNNKRIPWDKSVKGKKRISESYMKTLTTLSENSESSVNKRELSIADSFSGNSTTLFQLAKSPQTICDFSGVGLKKFGAWFKIAFADKSTGSLLCFIDSEKINFHHLAELAIRKVQRFAGKNYGFSWIDLAQPMHTSSTGNLKLSLKGVKFLTRTDLKNQFELEGNLFSISDTKEGIRLICRKKLMPRSGVKESLYDLGLVILPAVFLLLIWKVAFKVRFKLSIETQFGLIFSFTALLGALILFSGIFFYQREKQDSLLAEYKIRAGEMLEKIDQNFFASFGDLLRQYRHLNSQLVPDRKKLKQLLSPILKAQKEEKIEFASYVSPEGKYLFKAPQISGKNKHSIESKYHKFVSMISKQVLESYNSSGSDKKSPSLDPVGMGAITARPVEGLMANRSTLQSIVFAGDETLTYMDLTFNEAHKANGCFIVVHDTLKMQKKYLKMAEEDLVRSTGFQLAAFPKQPGSKTAYFPRYSYLNELPMWKLHDLVNQTQVFCSKIGRVSEIESLIVAIPGSNLKNYNLFIIIPLEKIKSDLAEMSSIFLFGAILTVFLVCALSYAFFSSIIRPIKNLANASKNTQKNQIHELANATSGAEIQNIATALEEIVLKTNSISASEEFKHLILPETKMQIKSFLLEGFRFSIGNIEQTEFFSFGQGKDKSVFFYHFRLKEKISKISNEIQLAMFKSVLDYLFSESEDLSPAKCLKEAEEFFRIHLRKNICGDIVAGLFFPEPRMITIAHCGSPIILTKKKGKTPEIIDFGSTEESPQKNHPIVDKEVPIKDLTALYLVSPEIAGLITNENLSSSLKEMFSDEPGIENLKTGIFTLLSDSHKVSMCFFKLSKSEELYEI